MTAVECLKQDIDSELKLGTKMVVNWDMYLQMEKQQQGYSEDEILNLMYYIRTNAIENKYSWKINGENLTDAENLTDKELLKKFKKKQDMKNLHKIKENIYITSDEEIKKGDWVFAYGVVIKISMFDGLPNDNWKKIILTTDQNLISDGIEGLKKK